MNRAQPELFRRQALEFQRRGRLRGDVLHITPQLLRVVERLLLALLLMAAVFVCTAELERYAAGPALVLLEQRYELTANRAGVLAELNVAPGQRVKAGQLLLRLGAEVEHSELSSIERELDDQLILLLRQPADRVARSELLSLRARRTLAETELERSLLRAPHAGVVSDVRVRVGQRVEPGLPLLALRGEGARLSGARLIAFLPAQDRPRIQRGMTMQLRIAGFERNHLALQVDQVDEQVLGPREALHSIGSEFADALAIQGPVVLVQARLEAARLRSRGIDYQLHHGMQARAEIAVEREPLLYALLPGLREALGDVL